MGARNQVVELENRIAKLEQENLRLQEKVTFLTRKLYGRSTERTSALGIEGQMSLFDEAETSVNPKSAEPDMKDVGSYVRRKYSGQREELLKETLHACRRRPVLSGLRCAAYSRRGRIRPYRN